MIDAQNIKKSFGNDIVLDGVNLHISKGESCAIIGGSGSGKTILAKCLLGLIEVDSGDITKIDMHNVGVLFQGGALFDSLPVWRNVAFRAIQAGQSKDSALALAESKLARVGMGPEVLDRMPAELSGGMQKRVALARAIADDPDVLVFDEPTTGLDPVRARQINLLIRDIIAETGATALTITHDLSSVVTIANTIAFLHNGRIHWRGPVSELKSTEDPVLRPFLSGEEH